MTALRLTSEEKRRVAEVRQTVEAAGFYFSVSSALSLVEALRAGKVVTIEEIDSLPPEKAALLYQRLAAPETSVSPVSGEATSEPKPDEEG
jgi:hypothetical protein